MVNGKVKRTDGLAPVRGPAALRKLSRAIFAASVWLNPESEVT